MYCELCSHLEGFCWCSYTTHPFQSMSCRVKYSHTINATCCSDGIDSFLYQKGRFQSMDILLSPLLYWITAPLAENKKLKHQILDISDGTGTTFRTCEMLWTEFGVAGVQKVSGVVHDYADLDIKRWMLNSELNYGDLALHQGWQKEMSLILRLYWLFRPRKRSAFWGQLVSAWP